MPLQTDKVPSRWGTIIKTLSNKKAIDMAFQKHQWEMEQEAQNLASGERREETRGYYDLEKEKERNSSDNTPEKQAMAAAMQWARDQALDLQTPEQQAQFQTAYNMFLHQFTGGNKGAMAAATGDIPTGDIPTEDVQQEKPGLISRGARFLWNSSIPGRVTNAIRGGYKQSSPSNVPDGTKAKNKETGEVLIRRNGKWVKE